MNERYQGFQAIVDIPYAPLSVLTIVLTVDRN